jgi:hypothetical protein
MSVTECLVNVEDLSAKWAELASKDVPAGLELLDEDEYKAVIDDVKRKLWNQTKELCGVTDEEEVHQVDEDISALADLFIQNHEVALHEQYNGTGQIDLFSLVAEQDVSAQVAEEPQAIPFETIQQPSYQVEMTTIVTRIAKKRSKKKEPVVAAQLAWLFDEATN